MPSSQEQATQSWSDSSHAYSLSLFWEWWSGLSWQLPLYLCHFGISMVRRKDSRTLPCGARLAMIALTGLLITLSTGSAFSSSMSELIDVKTLKGRIFFIADDLSMPPVPGHGILKRIYVMPANGSNPRRLAASFDSVWDLTWYSQIESLGFSNISADQNLSGWFLLNLSNVPSGVEERANRISRPLSQDFRVRFNDWATLNGKYLPAYDTDTLVTLSPDGSKVAGVVYDSVYPLRYHVCIANTHGTEPPHCVESGCSGHSPIWSPDGQWLVFAGRVKADRAACNMFELFIVDQEGNRLKQLTDVPGKELTRYTAESIVAAGEKEQHWHKSGHPSWSPDGQWIAFESTRGICRIHPDGTGFEVIIENGFSPTWSPDSKMIAYAAARKDLLAKKVSRPYRRATSIYVSWADGTGATEITRDRNLLFSDESLNWAE